MRARISRELHDRLLALAAASPDREVCGLLFGAGCTIAAIAETTNVAASPADSFEIDPAALIRAHRREREGRARLLGHYHSHPRGAAVPSSRDAAAASPDGRLWIVIGGGELRAWRFAFAGFVGMPLSIDG